MLIRTETKKHRIVQLCQPRLCKVPLLQPLSKIRRLQ